MHLDDYAVAQFTMYNVQSPWQDVHCTSCHGLWSRISGVEVAVETEEERIMKVMMMRGVGRTRTRTTTMMMMMMEGCIWPGMWLGQEMRMQ